jgi:hypothetical protein
MKVKIGIALAPNPSFNTSPTTSPNVCNLSRSSRLLVIPANIGTLNAICNSSCRLIQDSPPHLPLYQNFWNIEAMCNTIWRMIIHMKITMVLRQLGILSCNISDTLIIVLKRKSLALFSDSGERKYSGQRIFHSSCALFLLICKSLLF